MTPEQVRAAINEAKRRRSVNWLFVAIAVAVVVGAIVVLPRLGALGWIGGG